MPDHHINLQMDGDYPLVEIAESLHKKPIETTEDSVALVKGFCTGNVERLIMITTDKKDIPINMRIVSIGGSSQATLSTRVMAREAVRDMASGVVLIHNHPGDSITPSSTDIDLSDLFENQLDVLEINLIDFIVVSGDRYQSAFAPKKERENTTKSAKAMMHQITHAMELMGMVLKELGLVTFAVIVFSLFVSNAVNGPLYVYPQELVNMLLLFPAAWAIETVGRFMSTFVWTGDDV